MALPTENLYCISQDKSYDVDVRCEAESVARKMQTFSFCCSTVMWHKILNQINLVSKILQNINMDMASAVEHVQTTVEFLKNMRSEQGFQKILEEAAALAEELTVEKVFVSHRPIRSRQKKKMFAYEAVDEPVEDPERKYKIDCFYAILNVAINSLQERFNQLNDHKDKFRFLYDVGSIKTEFSKVDLRKHCTDLSTALTEGTDADIDAVELYDELLSLSELIKPKTPPAEVLAFISTYQLTPNVAVALRILLILPVTVASGERSFSKLKIIKNYLRSTIGQSRLTGLALIAIESTVAKVVDYTNIIKNFALKKARKVNLL